MASLRCVLTVALVLALAEVSPALASKATPADASFEMGVEEQTLSVTCGSSFKVKLLDFQSTGFVWFLESMPSNIRMLRNESGGGVDEPPFIMCELEAANNVFGKFEVIWLHARPWQKQDPESPKGHAKLHVTVKQSKALTAPVPADITYASGEKEHTLAVKAGANFKVKLPDLRSTGFSWYLESLPSNIQMKSNHTGGGKDEAPFVMCEMVAAAGFTGKGDVKWLHAKPWELKDPKADRGHAVLHLTAAEEAIVVV